MSARATTSKVVHLRVLILITKLLSKIQNVCACECFEYMHDFSLPSINECSRTCPGVYPAISNEHAFFAQYAPTQVDMPSMRKLWYPNVV